MKKINTIMISVCILLWSATNLKAQQNTVGSGGDASGSGGTVSYTVGQLDYITASGIGGTMSEGVQQPYIINVATGVQETDINLTCSVSPNPTADYVVLTVQKNDVQDMSYSLMDVEGQDDHPSKLKRHQHYYIDDELCRCYISYKSL